jgi:hypothetical protein
LAAIVFDPASASIDEKGTILCSGEETSAGLVPPVPISIYLLSVLHDHARV